MGMDFETVPRPAIPIPPLRYVMPLHSLDESRQRLHRGGTTYGLRKGWERFTAAVAV